ncbi:MAG: hypothetical protein QOK04_934 [Solirubrobacteraceae bacterium]|jgi:hypothetical protein|nr:hypothetical protein [Solirubrobacteraceae bacterium]MEA2159389.1 hypothetical protein [Solirubrobacteraceae bacterium]
MADWATISSLATAGGTLGLAAATFSAVRASNRSARLAEQALQEQRRPLLVHARLDDPVQKTMFLEGHWIRTEGSQAVIDEESGVLYLGLALRNVGSGIAVLQGWHPWPDLMHADVDHPPQEDFRRQVRDIYIAPGDVGMWQGALRDANDDVIRGIAAARAERRPFSLDLLYSDQVGGQRTISRFAVTPVGEDRWLGNVGLHWNLDLAGPR